MQKTSASKVIAVVDDEPDILELVTLHLTKSNFKVKGFATGNEFLRFLASQVPDLLVLDLMLPDSDGLDICKNLKNDTKYANLPIIILTAKGDETEKVLGLELGADDYVVKPFSPKELVARVKAVLRRGESAQESKRIVIDNALVIDLQTYAVSINGKTINLTPTEFRILQMLAERRGWVFTREQILDYLWGNDKVVLDRTIDVHIKHLREKMGKTGKMIKNIRGIGYKLQ